MLGPKADQAAGEDGDEGDLDESDEVLLGPFEDDIQSTIAGKPGEGTLDHPSAGAPPICGRSPLTLIMKAMASSPFATNDNQQCYSPTLSLLDLWD